MRLKYLIRDFKWVITPAAYILLMIIISLIFIMKNSNHDLIADKQDIIDGVSFGSKIEIDKINKPSEAENEILNQLINIELLFDSQQSSLEDIDNIKRIFGANQNGEVVLMAYFSNGVKNCKKLKYFSLGQNGKHYASTEDNSISSSLTWNSKSNKYVYYNFYKPQGLDVKNNCLYLITAN